LAHTHKAGVCAKFRQRRMKPPPSSRGGVIMCVYMYVCVWVHLVSNFLCFVVTFVCAWMLIRITWKLATTLLLSDMLLS
jgi:hypothetical protein